MVMYGIIRTNEVHRQKRNHNIWKEHKIGNTKVLKWVNLIIKCSVAGHF